MELAFMHFQHKTFPFLLISGGKSCVKPVCCLNQNVPQRKNCWSYRNKKGTAGFPETDNSAFQGCNIYYKLHASEPYRFAFAAVDLYSDFYFTGKSFTKTSNCFTKISKASVDVRDT